MLEPIYHILLNTSDESSSGASRAQPHRASARGGGDPQVGQQAERDE